MSDEEIDEINLLIQNYLATDPAARGPIREIASSFSKRFPLKRKPKLELVGNHGGAVKKNTPDYPIEINHILPIFTTFDNMISIPAHVNRRFRFTGSGKK